ncbi:surface protease GP63, putative [Trypanosoma cruzi marinkellei]|uniref:Leishmanolysin-like peptidase n=1 Tax=Trypanosoma cruzi marinkellei TaxID=85056 RepID=K2N4E7_TRYCR|nr:surface protease GP63, putative [Trypanosoma cruzi marinkellei]
MPAVCIASGCLALILTHPCFLDDAVRADGVWVSPVVVGDAPLGAPDALPVCGVVWRDRWVPVRIKASTTDPCDSRGHCGFSWSCTANSLGGAFCCGNGVVSSAHGNAVAEEVVPAAVKLHADRLLVQPLEAPLLVPSFATGSVCSLFTVPAEHVSVGVANADIVRCVAAAPGGVWALPCVTLEDGRPTAGAMSIARPLYFTDASPPASPRT